MIPCYHCSIMKTCKTCGVEKELTEFYVYKHGDKRTVYASCKPCHREKLKSKYTNETRAEHRRASREKAMAYVNSQKSKPCADCKVSYPSYVMDFDHVRGEKFRNLAKMIGRNSMAEIKTEIAKCDLVCSNCHRERTYQRKSND